MFNFECLRNFSFLVQVWPNCPFGD